MELSTWFLYISVISILILSPGPSTLLCVSDGLKFGKKKSIATVLGGAVAALILMTISASGLGAVLAASEKLFFVIKIVGAGYLIYLGCNAWKEGKIQTSDNDTTVSKIESHSTYSLFRRGFMVGISNPKDLLFFIALFPSFLNTDLPLFEQYTVLAVTWFCIDCTSMFMYAGLGSKISPWLSKTKNINLVNRTVGGVFIILGSALAVSTGMDKKI